MDLKSTKKILDEIFDLCSQLEDQILSEAIEGIYNDIISANTISKVLSSAEELMIFIKESDWSDLEEVKFEIEELYNQLFEDD